MPRKLQLDRKLIRALLAGLLVSLFATAFVTSQAAATPIDAGVLYQILDHPDGSLDGPDYALRLDGLSGNSADDFTFSSVLNGAQLTIVYDDQAATIKIEGTVYGGHLVGNAWVNPQLWQVSFMYGGVTESGGKLESTPGTGIGTIMGLTPGSSTIGLVDKANMAGLAFRLDTGHRLNTNEVTGHGWLTHDAAPRTSYQDWLFRVGDPIPEPNSALLIGAGLIALASRRRR